ncbi:hypothetical protein RI367_003224 [Sorochytrium milnesiophthora]
MADKATKNTSTAAADGHGDQQQQQQKDGDKRQLPQLGNLEEDDEFEDFPAEDWAVDEEDKDDIHNWEDNWDDDDVDDDFTVHLRYHTLTSVSRSQRKNELQKVKDKMQQ